MGTTAWHVASSTNHPWRSRKLPSRTGRRLEIQIHGQRQGWQSVAFNNSGYDVGRFRDRLIEELARDEAALIVYIQDSDFAFVCAFQDGKDIARYLLNQETAEYYSEAIWALDQCVSLHGVGWEKLGLRELADWSAAAPNRLTLPDIEALVENGGEGYFDTVDFVENLFVRLGLPW